jgi:hypothetical protein
MTESAEADFLAKAINEWKREFERIRWQQWESLSPQEQRHAQDHTLGGYILSDSKYPFTKRPLNCLLSLYEIKLALWAARGDFDEAAIRLRVTPDRLRQAVKGVSELEQYVPSKKQRKREAGEPLVDISLRNFGGSMTVRIGGLPRGNYIIRRRVEDDRLAIDIDPMPTKEQAERRMEIHRLALENARRGGK